jgi:hypothetical protein
MPSTTLNRRLGRSLTTCRHCGSMLIWRTDRRPWQDGDVTPTDSGVACCTNDECAATFAAEVRLTSLSDRLAPRTLAASGQQRRHQQHHRHRAGATDGPYHL